MSRDLSATSAKWTHQHAVVLVDADGRSWPESESSREKATRLLHDCGASWFGSGLHSISPLIVDAWDYGKTIGYWVGYEVPLAPRDMTPLAPSNQHGLRNRPTFIVDAMRGSEEVFPWDGPGSESDWRTYLDRRYKEQEDLIQKIADTMAELAPRFGRR